MLSVVCKSLSLLLLIPAASTDPIEPPDGARQRLGDNIKARTWAVPLDQYVRQAGDNHHGVVSVVGLYSAGLPAVYVDTKVDKSTVSYGDSPKHAKEIAGYSGADVMGLRNYSSTWATSFASLGDHYGGATLDLKP